MIINIVSSDKRYFYLNKMLNDSGYCSKIVSSEENVKCDFLILSVKNDLSEEELEKVQDRLGGITAGKGKIEIVGERFAPEK